ERQDLERVLPAGIGNEPFDRRREQKNTDPRAGVDRPESGRALGREPLRDQHDVRHHADEAESQRAHEAEVKVKLPEARNSTAEKQPRGEQGASGRGDFFWSEAVEEMADHRGDDLYGGEDAGGDRAAPAEAIEERDVKDTKRGC